jgi:hypothetical protein
MKTFTNVATCAVLLLMTLAPALAEEPAKQPAAAEVPAGGEGLQSSASGGGCQADGKCCGSAACAEAKKQQLKEGGAAGADCPCRRNKNKPHHNQ